MRDTSLHLLPLFLRWYWVERPAALTKGYMRYARALGSVFSFIYLIKTFFAPWKSIRDVYPRRGFNMQQILETLTLNLTARVIGAIVRFCALIGGVLVQAVAFFCFAAYLLLWISLPFLIVGGIVLLWFP